MKHMLRTGTSLSKAAKTLLKAYKREEIDIKGLNTALELSLISYKEYDFILQVGAKKSLPVFLEKTNDNDTKTAATGE